MEGKVIFGKLLTFVPQTSLEASNFGPGKKIIILQKKQQNLYKNGQKKRDVQ
jgi:hypothetical protein